MSWHGLSGVDDFNISFEENILSIDPSLVPLLYQRAEWMRRLPELSVTVNMEPPPRPMLCGFISEVQSSAAMAPSTAEPPFLIMSLKDESLIDASMAFTVNTQ